MGVTQPNSSMMTPKSHLYSVIGVFVCLVSSSQGVVVNSPSSCDGDYSYQYGEFCYRYVGDKVSWQEAQKNCNTDGGHLAEVLTAEHNAYVESIIFEHEEQTSFGWGLTTWTRRGNGYGLPQGTRCPHTNSH